MSQETIPLVLESCPFCESPAEIAIWGRTTLGAQYYVCCTNIVDCRCMTPWNYSVLLVVAHWNRRPSAQAVDWRAEFVRAVAGYLSDMHGESEQDAVSMAEAKAQALQAALGGVK